MRETRLYGSEGGEAKAFPTPIIFKELNCYNVTYFVTVQPLTLNSAEEPTPGPSQEGNTKSPLLGGDLGVGELLPYFLSLQSFD